MNIATKLQNEATKKRALHYLGWDELQYAEYQESAGIEYLKKVIGADDWGVKHLIHSSIFWQWWINHWNRIDETFIGYAGSLPQGMRITAYHSVHDPEGFDFFPHKVIMDLSYAEMIEELTHSKKLTEQSI